MPPHPATRSRPPIRPMAEPAVALSFRTDGATPAARARITRNVVAIATRPTFTPADMAIVKVVPSVPHPSPPREQVVRRAKAATGRNTIRARFLATATQELYERLGEFERRVVKGSVIRAGTSARATESRWRASPPMRRRVAKRSGHRSMPSCAIAMRLGESRESSWRCSTSAGRRTSTTATTSPRSSSRLPAVTSRGSYTRMSIESRA